MADIELVFKGRNNTNDLLLKADGVVADLSAVTKMGLVSPDWSADSDTYPDAFDWSIGDGVVHLALGGVEPITIGWCDVDLIIWDDDHLDGVNWGGIRLFVKAE